MSPSSGQHLTWRPCRPRITRTFEKSLIDRFPANRVHERIDIGRGFRAIIDMIGVLVHIERENRRAAGERVAMVRGPLVHQLAVARRPRQQNPPGAAGERLAHRHKFRAPALVGAEIPRQGFANHGCRSALLAQTVEEQLMEDHRVHRDELLALEPVDQESGSARGVELGELLDCAIRFATLMMTDGWSPKWMSA